MKEVRTARRREKKLGADGLCQRKAALGSSAYRALGPLGCTWVTDPLVGECAPPHNASQGAALLTPLLSWEVASYTLGCLTLEQGPGPTLLSM